jgi:hypothetical protein
MRQVSNDRSLISEMAHHRVIIRVLNDLLFDMPKYSFSDSRKFREQSQATLRFWNDVMKPALVAKFVALPAKVE